MGRPLVQFGVYDFLASVIPRGSEPLSGMGIRTSGLRIQSGQLSTVFATLSRISVTQFLFAPQQVICTNLRNKYAGEGSAILFARAVGAR